jgi:hypothetical protein
MMMMGRRRSRPGKRRGSRGERRGKIRGLGKSNYRRP